LPLARAELRRLGYPRRVLPGGKHPEVPDYSRIESTAEWGTHAGFFTRFGDVRELLAAVDGRFAVMSHGEEIALSFDAEAPGALLPGWKRTFLLYSSGFEKGRDLHGAYPFTVEPLPFPGMPSYPYPEEAAPGVDGSLDYLGEWNTRLLSRDS
jgi:hypothetical protein